MKVFSFHDTIDATGSGPPLSMHVGRQYSLVIIHRFRRLDDWSLFSTLTFTENKYKYTYIHICHEFWTDNILYFEYLINASFYDNLWIFSCFKKIHLTISWVYWVIKLCSQKCGPFFCTVYCTFVKEFYFLGILKCTCPWEKYSRIKSIYSWYINLTTH